MAGKRLQPVESAHGFKRLGVQLDRGMRREHARATASSLLRGALVGCAVRAQEKTRIAAGRRAKQRLSIPLALQYGPAKIMRPDAAEENGVAIVQQVLRRDGGGDAGPGAGHEFDRTLGADVF